MERELGSSRFVTQCRDYKVKTFSFIFSEEGTFPFRLAPSHGGQNKGLSAQKQEWLEDLAQGHECYWVPQFRPHHLLLF